MTTPLTDAKVDWLARIALDWQGYATRLLATLAARDARIATIADEAFGPVPVQSADDNLTAIERGVFEMRKENERLRTALAAVTRERDEAEKMIRMLGEVGQ